MWFRLGLQSFIAKKIVYNDCCDIFISDCIRIWHKQLSNNELLSISQKLNPLFEASIQKLKEITLNLFDENVQVQKEIKEENNDVMLKLESNKMGVKFQFQVLLKQGDGEMLYKEFTLPLLLAVVNMQSREKKLIEIIEDKDAEIKEYRQSHGIIRTYNTTNEPSTENDFDAQDSLKSLINRIICNPSVFLDFIDKKLFFIEKELKGKQEEGILMEKLEEKAMCDKNDKNVYDKTAMKINKNIHLNDNLKPCVNIGNNIVKKRKKQIESFKIKF